MKLKIFNNTLASFSLVYALSNVRELLSIIIILLNITFYTIQIYQAITHDDKQGIINNMNGLNDVLNKIDETVKDGDKNESDTA